MARINIFSNISDLNSQELSEQELSSVYGGGKKPSIGEAVNTILEAGVDVLLDPEPSNTPTLREGGKPAPLHPSLPNNPQFGISPVKLPL